MNQNLPEKQEDNSAAALLKQSRTALMRMIPKDPKLADRLLAIAIREVQMNPAIGECTIPSILDCAVQTAKLGLEIGGVLAQTHLVPFKTKKGNFCTLIVGYRGYIALAKRGNQEIADMFPCLVYEDDSYSVHPHTSQISHRYDVFSPDRKNKPILGAYLRVIYKDGRTWDWAMTTKEIEKRRAVAKTDFIWKAWKPEMYMKTVVLAGCKYLDLSAEASELIGKQAMTEVDLSPPSEGPTVGVDATKAAMKANTQPATETIEAEGEVVEVDKATGEVIPSEAELSGTSPID